MLFIHVLYLQISTFSYKKFSSSGRDLFCLITNNEGKSRRNACEYSVRAIHDHKFIPLLKFRFINIESLFNQKMPQNLSLKENST